MKLKIFLSFCLFVLFFCAITWYRLRPYQVRRVGNPCFTTTRDAETKRFVPGCRGETEDAAGRKAAYEIDEHGFRKTSALLGAGKGGAPILMVGDSITEGFSLQAPDSLPARLEAELGVPVYNAGVSGTSTSPQLFRVRRLAKALRPRLVVWQLAENDYLEEKYFAALAVRGPDGEIQGFPLPEPHRSRNGWARDLAAKHSIFTYLQFALSVQTLQHYANKAPAGFDHCQAYARVKAFSEAEKIPVVYVAVPPYGVPRERSELEKLLKLCPGIQPVVDLFPVLTTREQFQEDDLHLTVPGVEAAVKALAPALRPFLPQGK